MGLQSVQAFITFDLPPLHSYNSYGNQNAVKLQSLQTVISFCYDCLISRYTIKRVYFDYVFSQTRSRLVHVVSLAVGFGGSVHTKGNCQAERCFTKCSTGTGFTPLLRSLGSSVLGRATCCISQKMALIRSQQTQNMALRVFLLRPAFSEIALYKSFGSDEPKLHCIEQLPAGTSFLSPPPPRHHHPAPHTLSLIRPVAFEAGASL